MSKRKKHRFPATRLVTHVCEYPDHDVVHLTDEGIEILERQRDSFREKFGRDPEAADPLFWDPDEDTPTPLNPEKLRRVFIDAAAHAGKTPKEALGIWDYLGSDEHRKELRRLGIRRKGA